MNWTLIKHLVSKDWYFNRAALSLYTIVGVLSLLLMSLENKAMFYTGNVLLISAVIVVGAHLIFTTVIIERKEQNLTFVMSLPISFMEYTTAKILITLGAYLLIWSFLVLGALSVIWRIESIPDGLIPFTVIALLELVVAYILVLAVAIITESEAWTIVIMTLTNIGVSLFWFFLGSFESIAKHIEGASPVWNSIALYFIAVEVLIATLLIGLTFYFQSRKKDFL